MGCGATGTLRRCWRECEIPSTQENIWAVPWKVKRNTYYMTQQFWYLGIYPRKMKTQVHIKTCILMLAAALIAIPPSWKVLEQPNEHLSCLFSLWKVETWQYSFSCLSNVNLACSPSLLSNHSICFLLFTFFCRVEDVSLLKLFALKYAPKCWHFQTWGFWLDIPGASDGKESAAMQETQIWSLGREDPLEKEMAAYSSILAWEIPWTEEPGGLQSMG